MDDKLESDTCRQFKYSFNETCHPGDHYWDYYPGALSLTQVLRLISWSGTRRGNLRVSDLLMKWRLDYMTGDRDRSPSNGCQGACSIVFSSFFLIRQTGSINFFPAKKEFGYYVSNIHPNLFMGKLLSLTHWGLVTQICLGKWETRPQWVNILKIFWKYKPNFAVKCADGLALSDGRTSSAQSWPSSHTMISWGQTTYVKPTYVKQSPIFRMSSKTHNLGQKWN